MDNEPTNEQGVVYLFALCYRQLGFKGVERIQTGFPDCVAPRPSPVLDAPVQPVRLVPQDPAQMTDQQLETALDELARE
jgi:hypothetical protein